MRRFCLLMAVASLVSASGAFAHKMMAAATVRENGSVLLQAFFPDGSPARGVRVEVRRPDGSLFRAGETNEEGKMVARAQGPAGRWTAALIASAGHRTETEFTLRETGAEPKEPAASTVPKPAEAPAERPEEPDLARRQPVPWFRLLAGLGFVLGLSAFIMCLKLRAEVRGLRDRSSG